MDDTEFAQLQLRATICPQQARWAAPEHVHWQRLHEAANEVRERVSKFYTLRTRLIATPIFPAMTNRGGRYGR